MNGGGESGAAENSARAHDGEGIRCSKGVDYLRRNGVPGLLCSLSGRRIEGSRAICIYLQVPDYAPFSWLAMRSDGYLRAAVSHLRHTQPLFFALDIISGSVSSSLFAVARFFPRTMARL